MKERLTIPGIFDSLSPKNSPAPDTLTHTTHQERGRVGEGFGKREPAAFPEAVPLSPTPHSCSFPNDEVVVERREDWRGSVVDFPVRDPSTTAGNYRLMQMELSGVISNDIFAQELKPCSAVK
jgi:hypothetical protein